MSRYALSKRSSSYYLKQFREDRIEIQPARDAGMYEVVHGDLVKSVSENSSGIYLEASPGAGILTIEAGHSSFDLCFPCEGKRVDSRFIEVGRDVLGQIVEMDSAARELTLQSHYREELAYVDVSPGSAELHYFANTVNAEWSVRFLRGEDGRWVLADPLPPQASVAPAAG